MAHRTITDILGTRWNVWDTRPAADSRVSPGLRHGWLTFESVSIPPTKRRLVPIPERWDALTNTDLLELLAMSTPVVAHNVRSLASTLEDAAGSIGRLRQKPS